MAEKKPQEESPSEQERAQAMRRMFAEEDVTVEVSSGPYLNDPDNFDVPEDDPAAGEG